MPDVSLRQQVRDALVMADSLRVDNEQLRAENAQLRERNDELAQRVAALADKVATLEGEASRDSSTSSKPPSSEGIETRKTRAQRRAEAREKAKEAKRAPGKQAGQPGKHLARREPDETLEYRPLSCRGCGASLHQGSVCGQITRQVIDLPKVTPIVTDHVAYRCRCACGEETLAEFPPAARAPVCFGPDVRAFALYLLDRQHLPYERCAELIGDLLGVKVSTGWLCGVQLEAATRLSTFTGHLKQMLGDEAVLHADETGTQVGTAKHWVHTISSKLLTLLAVHPRRGREALEDIGVLGAYAGTLVHDGLASYDYLDAASHAQCHAHLVRHLKDVGQTDAFKGWTSDMIAVLLDAKAASEQAAAAGNARVGSHRAAKIRARYRACLDHAFALLPQGPLPRRRHQGGWSIYERQAWNLATRMRRDQTDILRLLVDTRVPADNNSAERSLRMTKLHDRISGCFHSLEVAEAFVAIRSYIQTAAKHGMNLLAVLRQLFTDGPWIPPPRPAET